MPDPHEPQREDERDVTGPEAPGDVPTDIPPEAMPPAAAEPTPTARPQEPRRTLDRDLAEVQRGRPERAFNLGAVLGAVVAVAAAVFVIQNNQSTHFDWLWFDFELPLWTALLGAMAVGVALVVIGFVVHERRQRRIGRRQDAAGRLRRALGPSRGAPRPAR